MALLLGHTLGTPDHELASALELFAAAGLDGAEVIWQDGYRCAIPESDDGSALATAKRRSRELGLRIAALTPYVTELNSLDPEVRDRDRARIRAALEVAEALGAGRMRIYGGTLLGSEPAADIPEMWAWLVESLVELGEAAGEHGVALCVENHFGTMTVSAEETVRLVEAVASPHVGILYDQANLAFTKREGFVEAIALQMPWIRHVHVKDLEFLHPDRDLVTTAVASIDKANRIHASRMIGDGILDWGAIIGLLRQKEYAGSYALEYEYRWNPEDLPEPAVGIPESAARLRAFVEGTSSVSATPEPGRPAQ